MGFMSAAAGLLGSIGDSSFGSALQSVGSSFMSGLGGSLLGGSKGPSLSPDQKADIQFQGVKSSLQGPTPPPAGGGAQPQVSGTEAPKLDLANTLGSMSHDLISGVAGGATTQVANKIIDRVMGTDPVSLAKTQGKASRAFMDSAYPEANVWDKLGQSGSAAGAVTTDTSNLNARNMQGVANRQQSQVTNATNANAAQIAGLNGATSYVNTHDALRQQKPLIDAQVSKTNAETAATLSNTELNPARKQQLLNSAAASGEQAINTAANTQTTNAMRGPSVDLARHPGVIGNNLTSIKNSANDLSFKGDSQWFGLPNVTFNDVGDWVSQHAHNLFKQSQDSGGIHGATSRNRK